MKAITRWLAGRPAVALVLLAILTLPFVWGVTRVTIANPLDGWFVRGDPVLAEYEEYTQRFGSDEVVIIAVHSPDGVLRPPVLERVASLSEALAGIDLVSSVTSVATVADALGAGGVGADGERALLSRLEADPVAAGRLLSRDGKTTLIYVEQDLLEDDAQRTAVLADVREAVRDELDGIGVEHHLAGTGVIFDAINTASMQDLMRVFPAAALIATVLLLLALRSLVRVLVALLAAGVATIWSAGIFGLAGVPINLITTTVPTIVAVISLAMAVHLLRGLPREEARRPDERARSNVTAACFFSSLTSAAAFAALTVSDIRVLRELGLFAASGIMASFIVSILLCLPLAEPLGRRFPMPPRDRIGEWVASLGSRIMRRRGAIVVVFVLLLVGAVVGATRLRIDTFSLGFMPEDHTVTVDSRWLEENYGFYAPLVLEMSAEAGAWSSHDALSKLERLKLALEELPDVERVTAVTDLFSRDPGTGRPAIPESATVAGQVLATVREMAGEDRVDRIVDPTLGTTYVSASVRMQSAAGLGAVIDEAAALSRDVMGEGVVVKPVGYLPLYVRLTRYLATSFLKSLPLVIALNYGLLVLLLRSFKWAALGTPSNVLPIFLLLGGMGWMGVPLDVATVSIACIAFGILVDDTIHLLVHTRSRIDQGLSRSDAIIEALRQGGSAVTWTTIILVGGFSAFLAAEVVPVHYFGSLLGATLLIGLVCDITLVTIVVTTGRRRRGDASIEGRTS